MKGHNIIFPYSAYGLLELCHAAPVFQRNVRSLSPAKTDTEGASQTLVPIYQTTQYHISEDCSVNMHCHTNIKSHISLQSEESSIKSCLRYACVLIITSEQTD